MKKKIQEIFEQVLEIKHLSENSDFYQNGGNSLLAIQLYYNLITEFKDIQTNLKDIAVRPLSPKILFSILALKRKNPKRAIQRLNSVDPKRDLSNFHVSRCPSYTNSTPKNIFLTGSTGFIGSHILSELGKNSALVIYCLVRSKSKKSGYERLVKVMNDYDLKIPKNTKVISGDYSTIRLRLKAEEYNFLVEEIDTIIHTGADVNFEDTYKELRNSNVISTNNLIKFAGVKTPKYFHYISSLDILGIDHINTNHKIFYETVQKNIPEGGYAQSKFVAENHVITARNSGLKAYIYRLGEIMPSMQTGIPNSKSLFHLCIKALFALKKYPNTKVKLDYVPVDFVAKYIAKAIYDNEKSDPYVYHLCHPHGISLKTIMTLGTKEGLVAKQISSKKFSDVISNPSKNNMGFEESTLRYFSNENKKNSAHNVNQTIFDTYFLKENSRISQKNTRRILKKIKLQFPKSNKKMLTAYLKYIKNE